MINDRRRAKYNLAVSKTRIIVENVIGKLKRRFKVLGTLSMDVEKVPKVIYACAVLYNIYLSLQLIDLDDLFEG